MHLINQGFVQLTTLTAAIPVGLTSGSISAASEETPIEITSSTHGLSTGDVVVVVNVGGNTAANGVWSITKVDADKFTLDGSASNDTYTSGGTWHRIPPKVDHVMLQAEGQDVRWRDDGTDPTSAVGHILYDGFAPFIFNGKLQDLRVIQASATAKLNVTFYGNGK